MKRLVMELGGHAPFMVFADADFEHAVECCMTAKFATSGQDCLAANRIYVERGIYEPFLAALSRRITNLVMGSGSDLASVIGPLINIRAVEKQEAHIADALTQGARLLVGGRRHILGGTFFEPTLLADVPDDARIMSEETFGPVAAVSSFEHESDVLDRANNTEYGLVAYIHTRDAGRIHRLSRHLDFGMIAVNRTKITGAPIPFGGVKQSGLGREGSRLGLEAFTEVKYVCLNVA